MEIEQKCIGCGAIIQTNDPKLPGYVPKSALNKEEIICRRCFRISHYNDVQDVLLSDDDFLKILNQIGESDGLVVKIVDIFDFNGSWLPGIHRFTRGNVLLIGNKMDLLPKSVNKNRLLNWMKEQAKSLGLRPNDCILISAEKGFYIKEAMELMDRYRNRQNVYVIGSTNVGKSTFINRIIKEVTGKGDVITTSNFPGTTLDMIEIPLADGKYLIDTPGIINHHQMAHYVSKKDLKIITPKKEIKPRVYQMNEGQSLYFGGLARFDYIQGGRRSFVCYLSNELNIHRTKTEKADDLYNKHKGGLLSPPDQEYCDQFPPLIRREFSIKEKRMDIVFSGLGWVTVPEPGAVVAAYIPKGVDVYIRKSLI